MEKEESHLTARDLEKIDRWIKTVEDMERLQILPDRKYAVRKLKLSYKVIGKGKSRVVYDLGNGLVLKIAYSDKGIRDNRSEAALYRSVPPSVKKLLAKVIDYGHGWCIMEKIKVVNKKKVDLDSLYNLRDKLVRMGINPRDLTNRRNDEPRWNNFGFDRKGEIVVIDYGNFKAF